MDPDSASYLENFDELFVIKLVTLLILLGCSAFISGAEIAFFSLSSTELDEVEESGSKQQKKVATILEQPRKLLATILISNNFINILIVLIFAFLGEQLFTGITNGYLKFAISFDHKHSILRR